MTRLALLSAARVDLADALGLLADASRLDRIGLPITARDCRAFAKAFLQRRWARLADAEVSS